MGKAAQTHFAQLLLDAKVVPTAKLPFDCILGFHLVPDAP